MAASGGTGALKARPASALVAPTPAFKRPPRPATAGTIGSLVGRPPQASAQPTPQAQQPCRRPYTTAGSAFADHSSGFGLGRSRPQSAIAEGRRIGNIQRTASAPSSLDAGRHAEASSGNFRSPSLALQVQLRKRLAETPEDSGRKISEAQLRVYRQIFEQVLATNHAEAAILGKIKAAYDECVSPWVPATGCSAGDLEQTSAVLQSDTRAEFELEVALAPQIAELQQENRRLREAAGLLHRERLRRIAQHLEDLGVATSDASAESRPAPAHATSKPSAWSGMRVTSAGVRGNGF
eukprot:TRINITY_DN76842_c0_g1_i1.p1 TRINITY_DN76842_c0_g1~~TRINITY_DN76842_c0_g1_i1.p1  ORF type:complete len:309 (+),score=52.90 TRINITY_DN76842_c0_g1_i1:43-927(+)